MAPAPLRWVSALLVLCACTPDTEMIGTLDASSGSTSPSDTSVLDTSTGASDGSTAQATGAADDEGEPSSSGSTGAQDDSTSSDFPFPDVLAASCAVELEGNAMVSGVTPLGEVGSMFGWYATTGGGKCPLGYVAWFLPSAAAGDTQLDDEIDTVPDVVRVRFEIPEAGIPGEAAVNVEHWIDGDVAEIDGVATLEMGGGPLDMDTRLVGSFVIDAPSWQLSGEFSLQWCELLQSGPCGA